MDERLLPPIAVDVAEGCRMTALGRSKFLELVYAGEIDSVKVGKRRLVLVDSIRAYFDRLRSGKPADADTPAAA